MMIPINTLLKNESLAEYWAKKLEESKPDSIELDYQKKGSSPSDFSIHAIFDRLNTRISEYIGSLIPLTPDPEVINSAGLTLNEIHSLMLISGDFPLLFIISMDKTLAASVLLRFFNVPPDFISNPAFTRDAAGEIQNILFNNLLSDFKKMGLFLTPFLPIPFSAPTCRVLDKTGFILSRSFHSAEGNLKLALIAL